MTESEAIKELEKFQLQVEHSIAEEERCEYDNLEKALQEDKEFLEAFDMAISALKEIQQYREIGTVEECREAVEKQKAKELVYESDSVFSNGFSHYRMGKCPMCDRYYNSSDEVNYCSKCGQALMNENLEGMEDE